MNRKWDRVSAGEVLTTIGLCMVLGLLLAWLFYQSIYGMLLTVLLIPAAIKRKREEVRRQRHQQLELEFKECISLVAGALAAGYSMEHAWQAAEPDMKKLYGEDAAMCKELVWINSCVSLNEPIETALEEFAQRSGLEDVMHFCQVFSFAKRSGGNLIQIMGNAAKQISEKREIMQEIETVIAAKRMEQNLMNVIPLVLLAYIKLTSPEFLAPMYHNPTGILIMSICLSVYGAAFLLSEKIMRIEV